MVTILDSTINIIEGDRYDNLITPKNYALVLNCDTRTCFNNYEASDYGDGLELTIYSHCTFCYLLEAGANLKETI